jgi:putative glycosyltransferase (TIGR04348 family)
MPAMALPVVCLVSPARSDAHNGNAHTAARWQAFLAPVAQVRCLQAWDGQPADALIALHARRSSTSIARFAEAWPRRPLGVVLTGTDLYRDLAAGDEEAAHSLQCASHLAVLQPLALRALPAAARAKARVILQSASRVERQAPPAGHTLFVAVGHLRPEKDPRVLMAAARRLAARPDLRIVHIGEALDADLAREAEATQAACPGYRWLGGLPPQACRDWIARSQALVHMSRMEGGANVVIEALRTGVPVLASRIDGNLGLLGEGYEGVFPAGDDAALASLMAAFADDAAFAARLGRACEALAPAFAPEAEAAAVRQWLRDMMDMPALPQSPPSKESAP